MSSSKIFIDPLVGNVGIGVANPTAKLHVLGNARIQGDLIVNGSQTTVNNYTTVSSNVSIMNTSGVGPALRVAQTGSGAGYPVADFYDNDVSTTVPAMRIADGGNVGIGTANPQAKLHVNGEININNTINTAFTQLSVTAASLTAGYNTGGVTGPVGGVYTYTIGNGDNNASLSHPVSLDVGTTYEFTITASSPNGVRWKIENPVFNALSSDTTTTSLTSYTTTFRAINATVILRIVGSAGQTFSWNNFTVKRLDVLTNGNVGIGTTNPQAKLHIAGYMRMSSPIAFRMTNITSFSVPNVTPTLIQLTYAPISCTGVDTVNSRFTVPVAGIYFITSRCDTACFGGTVGMSAYIFINGNGVMNTGGYSNSSNRHFIVQNVFQLTVSDYVTIMIYQGSGSTLTSTTNGSGWSHEMCGYLIG
jgi:hypothetical protein